MKIANLMFGRGLGGIEQAFLDYNEALLLAGHEVLAVTHPLAAITPEITGNLIHSTLTNRGSWDVFAARRLRSVFTEWQPQAIICHGNRAVSLALLSQYPAPVIGITHNYQLKRFHRLDAVIAITTQLREAALQAGVAAEKISLIPNMVRLPAKVEENTVSLPHTPLIIGAMGRMVEKKGFHLLLDALAILKAEGVPFILHLGGTGRQEQALRKQATRLGIETQVKFCGWVEDKTVFFAGVDIFCLPSLHEPFGIVLLEAMAHQRPVIAFASEGPSEIIRQGEAIMVEKCNVSGLAEALANAIQRPEDLRSLASAGRALVEREYALEAISKKINTLLTTIR
jgi:glycosyltransferase involved in cell wall biosynthesis